jgi:hypothetical protein
MTDLQKAPFLADEKYNTKLKKINGELAAKRIDFALPKLTQEQDSVLANNLSFSCYRVAKFIFNNQGERTDTVSPICAVANVSDTVIGFEKSQTAALDSIGLRITCQIIPAKNRYGSKGVIGTWWLEVADAQKWQARELKAQLVA